MSAGVETISRAHRHVEGICVRLRGALLKGPVSTPFGIVWVISLRDALVFDSWQPEVTRLYFVREGREYIRSYPRLLTRVGSVRAAGRFAREIAAAQGGQCNRCRSLVPRVADGLCRLCWNRRIARMPCKTCKHPRYLHHRIGRSCNARPDGRRCGCLQYVAATATAPDDGGAT